MKKNKLFLSTLALILMISITLVGCSGGGGADGDTIKIGALGPLTGEVASYGTATINGVNLAIEEINANQRGDQRRQANRPNAHSRGEIF